MADRCYGCTSKYKFREKPTECPQCRRPFCNKCLDRKKVKETGATCVYCSQKQQKVNESEESEILQNFHERYYKHKNQGPPIVTRLQFDPKFSEVAQGRSKLLDQPVGTGASRGISAEDQEFMELEERFRKLREDRTSEAPSLEELQSQFDKFKGTTDQQRLDVAPKSDSNDSRPQSAKTEFEQTQELIQQMKEEAELDRKLEAHQQQETADLATRFDALRDKEHTETSENPSVVSEQEAAEILSGSSQKPESELDPEKLLHDLKSMTTDEEKAALQELASSDIQSLMHHIKPPHESESSDLSPKFLEDVTPSKPRHNVSERELQQLIAQAKVDMRRDQEARARDNEFMLYASKKASNLMDSDDSDSDGEVKSKPRDVTTAKPGSDRGELDFNWHHFGSKVTGGREDLAGAAADTGDWFSDDEEFDQQVHLLIEQMTQEAQLEERLESSGLSHVLDEKKPSTSNPSNIQPYSAIGHEDQLPWCCMCNADATVRCFDCDGDLYCVPCFSQGHEGFGLFDHRYAPYEPTSTKYM